MISEYQLEVLQEAIDELRIYDSSDTPSQWYEKHMVMPRGSAFPGPIRYDKTPYWREVVDCASPDHPAIDITVMGPAQMGKSVMVLNPIVGYTIALNPCNMLFLTGHSDLTRRAVGKIDFMIENCGLRSLIKPMVIKARNNKTGDTALEKEFRGGSFLAGSITNHNLMRQNDIAIAIADDLDAGQMAKEDTGSTVDLITGRTKAFEDKCKRYWVSSPQVKGKSLIELQFEKSDKRYWMVECPHCGNSERRITLEFSVQVDDKNTAGLVWKYDNFGRVDPKSVGYICQLCANFFTDQRKHELLNSGIWVPTCEPKEHNHAGFHVNGLYAAEGMTSWFTLAQKYVLCNPPSQPRIEADYQTFCNIWMGNLYDPPGTSIESKNILLTNCREYEVGVVPEALSIKDGNGRVVLLSLAADLGGRVAGINSEYDDVRLDWEVLAHSESGSTYSIDQGSIGTFMPAHMGAQDEARERWSYDLSKPNNVWKVMDAIQDRVFVTDTGRKMKIQIAGIDTGFAEHQAFQYIDRRLGRFNIVGLKGDKEHKYIPFGDNSASFKIGQSRSNLYILKVGKIKDRLSHRLQLRWDKHTGEQQPPGFLNFPRPAGGKYDYERYFLHWESEERRLDKDKNFIWQKKTPSAQNHFWDCAVYNAELREIVMNRVFREQKMDVKTATWQDFCALLLGGRK